MKSRAAKDTEQAAYAQIPAFTKIHGRPTRKDYNALLDEAMVALSEVDMPFLQNGNHGLLGEVCSAAKYQRIADVEYIEMNEPLAYDDDITAAMTAVVRRQKEAEHDERIKAWYMRKGALRGMCHSFMKAVNGKYY